MTYSDLSLLQWILALLSSFLIGISKSGVKGIGILVVAMMVFAFGAKASTGIILPMLIAGDVFAVIYYHRHAEWKYFFRLMPWMMLGVIFGAWLGKDLPEDLFKKGMAFIILICVIMMFWWDSRKSKRVPDHWSFAGVMGLSAGFTTMVGNLAGAFSNFFFLAMRVPKNAFIGTTAWLFLVINLYKVPFHVLSWGTINQQSLSINLLLLPAVIAGLLVGVGMVKKFEEVYFRQFVLAMTGLGALVMFFK